MKRIAITYLLLVLGLSTFGQTTYQAQDLPDNIVGQSQLSSDYTTTQYLSPNTRHLSPTTYYPSATAQDTLHLPAFTTDGHVRPFALAPYWYGHWGDWQLHSGLNVSLGASVFAQFGKHAYHGAGFGQSISAMYAMPLSENLSLAVGGYFNNMSWAHNSFREAGLSGVLGYRFDEHWEAYIYAQKSLTNNQPMPMPLYQMYTPGGLQSGLGDRIGAAVRYNFNPSFSIEVSIEKQWLPHDDNLYYRRYNYPVPK